jgi:hypothetical protein
MLKLKHDEPLSSFAFRINMRRYTAGSRVVLMLYAQGRAVQVETS